MSVFFLLLFFEGGTGRWFHLQNFKTSTSTVDPVHISAIFPAGHMLRYKFPTKDTLGNSRHYHTHPLLWFYGNYSNLQGLAPPQGAFGMFNKSRPIPTSPAELGMEKYFSMLSSLFGVVRLYRTFLNLIFTVVMKALKCKPLGGILTWMYVLHHAQSTSPSSICRVSAPRVQNCIRVRMRSP